AAIVTNRTSARNFVSRGAKVIGLDEMGGGAAPPLTACGWKIKVTAALLESSGLKSQMSVRNCAPPNPTTRPATMNQPLVVAGEWPPGAPPARLTPAIIMRPRAIHFMSNLPRPFGRAQGCRGLQTRRGSNFVLRGTGTPSVAGGPTQFCRGAG